MVLIGVIYGVFHYTVGNQILEKLFLEHGQEEKITPDCWEMLNNLLIPTKTLLDRPITATMHNVVFIGYPVGINDSRYERQTFLYNCVLVFNDPYEDLSNYRKAVQQFSKFLNAAEKDHGYLLGHYYNTQIENEKKTKDQGSEGHIFDSLNGHRKEAVAYYLKQIPLKEVLSSYLLHLKEGPKHKVGITNERFKVFRFEFSSKIEDYVVSDYDVPMCVGLKTEQLPPDVADVVESIDANTTIVEIAAACNQDISMTKSIVQTLMGNNACRLIDKYSIDNYYTIVNKKRWASLKQQSKPGTISHYTDSATIKNEMRSNLGGSPELSIKFIVENFSRPIHDAKRLSEIRLPQYGVNNLKSLRRHILFFVYNGYLQRLHEYPLVLTKPSFETEHWSGEDTCQAHAQIKLFALCNGTHHLDSIAVALKDELNPAEIAEILTQWKARYIRRLEVKAQPQ